MALEIGTKAPDFTLKTKNEDGLKDVTLSDNFGKKKTVLLFFPFAFSSVCKDEMCRVNTSLYAYKDLNAEVFGISVDSPYSQEKMAFIEKLRFPLLSDFNKNVSANYDVLYSDLFGFNGVSKRSAFVIDETGVITYSESSEDPKVMPNFEAIQSALA